MFAVTQHKDCYAISIAVSRRSTYGMNHGMSLSVDPLCLCNSCWTNMPAVVRQVHRHISWSCYHCGSISEIDTPGITIPYGTVNMHSVVSVLWRTWNQYCNAMHQALFEIWSTNYGLVTPYADTELTALRLAQTITCCLMKPNYDLNQRWLIVIQVQ